MSPFSIQLHLGSESPVTFEAWIEDAFSRIVPKGTAFATATAAGGKGRIVTNGPTFLSSHEKFAAGQLLTPGTHVASGAAEGEDIPYGKPYCVFVLDENSRG